MPHSISKRKTNYYHAKHRMLERYGISLTKEKYKELCRQVQGNKSRMIYVLNKGKTVHLVKMEGKVIAVVYSRYQKNIVTILPPRH